MKLSNTINPNEDVQRGLFYAIASLAVAVFATLLLHELHIIAAISSLLFCLSAVYLYEKGAGGIPIKGRWFFLGLIALGIALSFFTIVAAHLVEAYDAAAQSHVMLISKSAFVSKYLFDPEVLRSEVQNLFFCVLFGAFGSFRVVSYIFASHKVHKQSQASQKPVA